ncbi:MAG TPA: hypothetical protein VFG30_23530, partial [Polyangiales bacterium]|nr:hypothetical protein [Polyangiales bacterium]
QEDCWMGDEKRFVEVGVTGDFPSNFTLDVFDPPPPEAMRQLEDGPAYAVGAVTALPREHPEGLTTAPLDNETFQEWADRDRDTCYIELDDGAGYMAKSDSACIVLHACTLDGDSCLHRELSCEKDENFVDFHDCEVVGSSGDATLGAAGYSVNYAVMYFDGPIEAGTPAADAYAGGDAISAGYHLYRVQLTAEPGLPDCLQSAFMEAAERYNAEHDTEWDFRHFFTSVPPAEIEPTLEEHEAFVCEYTRVLQEGDCRPIKKTYEEVGPESISIELGALTATSYM